MRIHIIEVLEKSVLDKLDQLRIAKHKLEDTNGYALVTFTDSEDQIVQNLASLNEISITDSWLEE